MLAPVYFSGSIFVLSRVPLACSSNRNLFYKFFIFILVRHFKKSSTFRQI